MHNVTSFIVVTSFCLAIFLVPQLVRDMTSYLSHRNIIWVTQIKLRKSILFLKIYKKNNIRSRRFWFLHNLECKLLQNFSSKRIREGFSFKIFCSRLRYSRDWDFLLDPPTSSCDTIKLRIFIWYVYLVASVVSIFVVARWDGS